MLFRCLFGVFIHIRHHPGSCIHAVRHWHGPPKATLAVFGSWPPGCLHHDLLLSSLASCAPSAGALYQHGVVDDLSLITRKLGVDPLAYPRLGFLGYRNHCIRAR